MLVNQSLVDRKTMVHGLRKNVLLNIYLYSAATTHTNSLVHIAGLRLVPFITHNHAPGISSADCITQTTVLVPLF
jgi:hypothetical protein